LLQLQHSYSVCSSTFRRYNCTTLPCNSGIFRCTALSSSTVRHSNPRQSSKRHTSTMSASTASSSDDDYTSRTQQSPLASQRARKQGNPPSEANRTGKFGGYFTLGYKEGFSQWVRFRRSLTVFTILTLL